MPHIVLEDKRQICVLEACIFTTADKYCFLRWPLPGVREETRLSAHAETLGGWGGEDAGACDGSRGAGIAVCWSPWARWGYIEGQLFWVSGKQMDSDSSDGLAWAGGLKGRALSVELRKRTEAWKISDGSRQAPWMLSSSTCTPCASRLVAPGGWNRALELQSEPDPPFQLPLPFSSYLLHACHVPGLYMFHHFKSGIRLWLRLSPVIIYFRV